MPPNVESNANHFMGGSSDLAKLMRAQDWSKHELGPCETWPIELKTTISLMLNSRFPMFVSWGANRHFFYNDAYAVLLGKKHPSAIGQRFEIIWGEIWRDLAPLVSQVDNGESVYLEDLPLKVSRHGYEEEAFFTFSYSPVYGDSNKVAGLYCAVVETTKRIQAERATNAERVELIDTLESMSDAFISVDKNWKIVRVNAHHEKHSRLSRETQIGKDVREVFFSAEGQQDSPFLKAYELAMETREPVFLENYYEPLDLWLEVRAYPKSDGGLAIFFSDIGSRKKAEREMNEAVSQLRNLADSMTQLAWIARPDGYIFWYNKRWYDYTGTDLEAMEGWGWQKVHHPDHIDHVVNFVKEAWGKPEPFELTFPLKGKDGEFRRFLTRVVPQLNSSGEIVQWFGTNTDIEESMLAQEKLTESEERLRYAMLSGSLGAWRIDLKPSAVSSPIYLSPEFLEIFGATGSKSTPAEIIAQYLHPDDQAAAAKALEEALLNRRNYAHEYRIITEKNGIRWILSRGLTSYADDGTPTTVDGFVMDVTARKLAELEVIAARTEAERAREEAERANELKSAFLANMSHEIRTPLGAMLGFADLLRDPGLTPSERQSFTNILSRNGESLSIIINDILDLSKVEAGHLTLEYTDTYPDQLGADVVSLLRVKAKEKDLVLEYAHDEKSPPSIVSDPTRVRQILLNLVGNAIKFTPFGSVKLRSFACKTDRGRDALCFEVSDTGIGVAEDQREKIFEMFVQADGSMTRRFGGTGLGLALSRSLARALGGDIVITESKEGVGSTFLVTIEDQPERRNEISLKAGPAEPQPAELPERALDGVKILVVDDAPDNQQLIWRYLTKQGAVVDSAENGLTGYKAALAGNFDLVLMDIQMPVMDGYSATQKLREAGYRKPIVAITAHAMNEVRKKALFVGYTDHLTKPINSKALISTIARLVRV